MSIVYKKLWQTVEVNKKDLTRSPVSLLTFALSSLKLSAFCLELNRKVFRGRRIFRF